MKLRELIALVVLSAWITGCTPAPDQDADDSGEEATIAEELPPTQGVTDTEVIFGTHTDLTGPIALYGVESVNGMRMRIDEANVAGGVHGRQITVIVEDSQYDVTNSIRAANKLLRQDRIFAMLLALGTPNNNAVLTDQLAEGVPNLFPLTGSIQMAEPFHPLKFTQRGIYYDEMREAARYFVGELGNSNPCVAYIDNDYGHEILVGIEDQLDEMGIPLTATTSHKTTETEFTAAVLNLRNAGCDVVFMGTVVRDTILIMDAIQTMGWEGVQLVGNNAAAGQPVASSGVAEGYYAYAHMTPIYPELETRQENLDWYNRYVELYGAKPDVPAMESYRSVDIAIAALEIAGRDLTRENFLSAIESMHEYKDPFGYTLSFAPDDHKGVDTSHLIRVENKRWVIQDRTVSYDDE